MEYGLSSHHNRCLLNCLNDTDPEDVLRDKQLLHTLRSFLRRCTKEQLLLLCGANSVAAYSAITEVDSVGPGAYNEASMRTKLMQTAAPNTGLTPFLKPAGYTIGVSRRIPSVTGVLCAQDTASPPPSLDANGSSYDDPGVDEEREIQANSAGGSMKKVPSSDADHIVIRAYEAIVNIINIRWSITGLPSQVSLLAAAETNYSDSPGARLFALRSKLRNEQHMAIAIDRVAAVLLVGMRDDLGESYDGVREKGFRTSIVGNKLLANQWNKSHKEVREEIRAAITYSFAEQIISPGINLLLGSRSQDVWEKRFSRKKVEALHRLLKQTEAGRVVLDRARDLDDAVITIKRILSIHIGYHWRCPKYASINTLESSKLLFKKLQGQLSSRDRGMRQLENILYSTLDDLNPNSRQSVAASRESSDDFQDTPISTLASSVSINKRKPSLPWDYDHSSKRRRYAIVNQGDEQSSGASELQFDTTPLPNTSLNSDTRRLTTKPSTFRGQCDNRDSSVNGVDESLIFVSQTCSDDHRMLDLASEADIQRILENADADRSIASFDGARGEEDGTERQTNPVTQYQSPEDCLSYNYGEQWGLAEDVTTLNDVLSLSW